ncbi:hypothetical protein CERSUDRAFT_89760, partial [Gelatoporia subvermispora B]
MSATADTPCDVHTCYVEPASRQPRLHIALDTTTRSGLHDVRRTGAASSSVESL